MARTPDGPPPPPAVQKLRLRYAKRGRLRFSSHRDFQRALERALRRSAVPMAYSAGFTPHPKVSYMGAAPTGTASEAEYLEIALAEAPDASEVRVTYYVPDKAVTRGTAQTMVRILSSDAARATSSRAEQVVFPGPVGKQWAVSHAGGEEEFLHRRRPGLKVTDLMNMPALVARSSAAMPIVASVLGLAPVRRLLDAGVQRFPVGPDAERRAAQAFVILVEIDPGRGKQRGVVVNGVDPYGLTAEILARSAARLASGKGRRVGVVSPAEAFDPVETLDSLAELGLSWKRLE